MNSKAVNGLSIGFAVAVHAGVLGVLLASWENESVESSLIDDRDFYIAATVVDKNPHRERKRAEAERKAAERTRRQQPRPKPLQRTETPKAKPAAKPKPVEPEPAPPLPATPEPEPGPDETAPEMSEAERELMQSELMAEIGARENARIAITDAEKARAYAAQIRQDIAKNWASPPSARNGMQALLVVHLVPTGEVVNVTLEETSGNDAFDRSVILAVRKAGRFQVPQEPRVFESNFREFTVLFRPENLRL